jgi:hypothetical protein
MAFVKLFTDAGGNGWYSLQEPATSETDTRQPLMKTNAKRNPETRPPAIDVTRTAAVLICTYGDDAAIVARKWARMAVQAGDVAREQDWEKIVNDVERRVCGDMSRDHGASD